jgi:hypothetical protein
MTEKGTKIPLARITKEARDLLALVIVGTQEARQNRGSAPEPGPILCGELTEARARTNDDDRLAVCPGASESAPIPPASGRESARSER